MRVVAVLAALLLAGCSSPQQPSSLGTSAPTAGAPSESSSTPAAPLSLTYPAPYNCATNVGTDSPVRGLPEVDLQCSDGSGTVRLSSLRGPLVLTIWASWCVPCREELPAFVSVNQQLVTMKSKTRIVGLNWLDDDNSAAGFAKELGINFPSLVDPDARVRAPLGINAQPATLFIDASGDIVHVERAPIKDAQQLRERIEKFLGPLS